MKVVVAEPLAQAGVEMLQAQAGWDVVVTNPKEYAQHLADCDALLVRSAVKVNKEVLAKAPKLRVVGRAGVGVDNVDLPAATAAGVLVMNTPGGNAVSVAEHTVALMLSLARAVPQASTSTVAGKWEKKKFMGTELRGKTLGVLGLGSIGREVVLRARGFAMRIVASDPYVSPQTAADLGVELLPLDRVLAESDYLTLHMALTPDTNRFINRETIARMKRGVRLVNCARGELVDQDALAEALVSGYVAGAGLDVFDPEPLPADHPLLKAPNLIATPHIGGSTEEAQEIVGVRIVEQVVEYLQHGVAINAVNMPALSPEQYRSLGPYVLLAERLGAFAAYISSGNPKAVRFTYSGKIGEGNTALIRNAGLAGLLNRSLSIHANLINALQIAGDRGLEIAETHEKRAGHVDSIRVEFETGSGTTTVMGAIVLDNPRLIQVDGIYCEAPLSGHITFLKNLDVPGVIGYVGSVLGRNSINIANFSLGREQSAREDKELSAIGVVETDNLVPEAVLNELLQNKAIQLARTVDLAH
ncbi:MAG: phosphoglycerate dehydrogenase [Acidobacteria bacterium]|nr:phosphoglycerate dehydrogenase [Acidobacteriota bacterium]